jgi:uncharacterized protein (DUF2236 family)
VTATSAHGASVLGHLEPAAAMGFTHASAIRRLSSEPVVGLVLQRALVLEVGHTKIGAGVEDHSSFRRVPYRRLWATLDAALRLVWGDDEVARGAARQVYSFHDHVNGPLPEPSAAWPAGGRYTAHDAALLLWVWATLIDTALCAFNRWLGPLPDGEADAYYADMCTFARFFGIPADLIPPDRVAFAAYVEGVLAGDELQPTPTSKGMVADVLWVPNRRVPDVLVRPLRVLTIGTLDPRLSDRFDLSLSPRDQRLFDRLDRLLRRFYRYRPAWLLRRLPEIYVAVRKPTIGLLAHRRRRPPRAGA